MPNAKLSFLALTSIWYVPSATCHKSRFCREDKDTKSSKKKKQNDSKHPAIRLQATTKRRKTLLPFAHCSTSCSRLKSFVLQTLTDEQSAVDRSHSTEWKTLETNISEDLLPVAKNNNNKERPCGAGSSLEKLNFKLHHNQGCAVQLNLHGWLLFNSKIKILQPLLPPRLRAAPEKICIQDDD